MLPAWVEQQGALRVVVGRMEKELQKRSSDIDQLLTERDQIEKFYDEKYDALVRCLSLEQENAMKSAKAKKRELESSLALEDEITKELLAEEQTLQQLQSTFNQTKTQLDAVMQDMQAFKADSIQQVEPKQSRPLQAPPELDAARARIEVLLKEKEGCFSERQTTEVDIGKAAAELEQQREHAARLEDFIQRLLQGDSGYLLDAAMKREASNILAAAAKLQRPSHPRQPPQNMHMGRYLVTAP
jgi:chromosome segregation ATPase